MGTFVRGVPGVIKYKMRLLAVGSQLGRPWSKAEVSSIKKLAILIVPTCCLPAGRQDRQGFWIAEWENELPRRKRTGYQRQYFLKGTQQAAGN
jgi:hypothetical protein